MLFVFLEVSNYCKRESTFPYRPNSPVIAYKILYIHEPLLVIIYSKHVNLNKNAKAIIRHINTYINTYSHFFAHYSRHLHSTSTLKVEMYSENIFFRFQELSGKNWEALCYPNQADENLHRGLSQPECFEAGVDQPVWNWIALLRNQKEKLFFFSFKRQWILRIGRFYFSFYTKEKYNLWFGNTNNISF